MLSFEVGELFITKGANAEIEMNEIIGSLIRYLEGDWGELCDEDKESNIEAISNKERILGKYISKDKKEFYIITEQDRSHTTILLTSEY